MKDKSKESQDLKKQVQAAAEKAGVKTEGATPAAEDNKDGADKNKSGEKLKDDSQAVVATEDKGKKQDGQQQAEAGKKDPAEAGLESKKGALLKDVEALRLEKRELAGLPGKPAAAAKTAAAAAEEPEEDGEDEEEEDETVIESGDKPGKKKTDVDPKIQSAIDAAVKPLQEKLSAQEKKTEKDVIGKISNNMDKFPLIHKSVDTRNQNWNTLLQHLPANFATIDRNDPVALERAMTSAYYAAFHDQIEADIAARAKAQGAAEAVQAGTADLGGTGTGENKPQPLDLTDEEKTIAKKMGISEEKFAARKAKRNG